MVLIDIVKKDKVNIFENKNILKIENKIFKISIKLKYLNLLKSRPKNLFKYKKVQSTSAIKELIFLTPNIKVVF